MKKKNVTRLTAILLASSMLLQELPVSAFSGASDEPAQDAAAIELTDSVETATEEADETSTPEIIGEEESLRDENEKHFRMSDGTYIAVSYDAPVHYRNAKGEWEDIDNSFTYVSDAKGDAVYRSENAVVSSEFSADLSDGMLFSSEIGDASVSMHLLDPEEETETTNNSFWTKLTSGLTSSTTKKTFNRNSKAAPVDEPLELLETQKSQTFDEKIRPEKLESSIRYTDVYPGVDILYTSYSHDIKEEIIVKRKQESYRYEFLLEMENLTARLNADGSVSLKDEKEAEVYHIPAPYMEDANGASSYDASYTLEEREEGTVLIVEASEEWINASDRAFPVSIDPTLFYNSRVETYDSDAPIYTTYVVEGAPTATNAGYQDLYIGYGSKSTTKSMYAYLYFDDLPTIPSGSVVTAAELHMYADRYSPDPVTKLPISVYEVTGSKPSSYSSFYSWINAINWNNKPAYNASNEIDFVIASSAQVGDYMSWEITELAKKWYYDDNKVPGMRWKSDTPL